MKFFSIKNFGKRFESAFGRFPFAILFSIICTICIIILIEDLFDFTKDNSLVYKLTVISGIAVPLFVAIQLWSEVKRIKNLSIIAHSIGFAFLALLFFTLSDDFQDVMYMINARLFGYFIAFHLLVSFIAYVSTGSKKSFWQFNISTFLSFLESALYSLILFLGLSLAFAAIENLFDADLHDEIYADTFIVIAGIFHTFYFLSELKSSLYEEDSTIEHHRIFGFFSKFILLPLTLIYFAILYAFSLKLLIQQEWSQGWISSLILGFSVTGILCYLFNYYLIKEDEKSLVTLFKKWFFPALLPMSIVLFLAVGLRVSNYGLTENRYIGILASIWLAGLSLYFILSKNKNIKFIPISLFAFVLLSILGPTNMSSIGIKSQLNRAEKILENNGAMENGKMIKKVSALSNEDGNNLYSIFNYLEDRDELKQLSKFQSDKFSIISDSASTKSIKTISRIMGMDDYYTNDRPDQPRYVNFYPNKMETLSISDYDYVQNFEAFSNQFSNSNSTRYKFKFVDDQKFIEFESEEGVKTKLSIKSELDRLLSLDSNSNTFSSSNCTLRIQNDIVDLYFVISSLVIEQIGQSYRFDSFSGSVFIKVKNNE
jgi:hypothetical protein